MLRFWKGPLKNLKIGKPTVSLATQYFEELFANRIQNKQRFSAGIYHETIEKTGKNSLLLPV